MKTNFLSRNIGYLRSAERGVMRTPGGIMPPEISHVEGETGISYSISSPCQQPARDFSLPLRSRHPISAAPLPATNVGEGKESVEYEGSMSEAEMMSAFIQVPFLVGRSEMIPCR